MCWQLVSCPEAVRSWRLAEVEVRKSKNANERARQGWVMGEP